MHRDGIDLRRCILRWPVMAALAFPVLGASSPQRGLSLQVPGDAGLPVPAPLSVQPSSKFAPAPLPNRDLEAPGRPRASTDPSVAAGVITRGDSYRGEGFSKGSSAQSDQEKHVRPGAGLNLTVPFLPN